MLPGRAGEAAGVRALRGEVHGAGRREGPQRARDPESEGVPEAGQGCSAGGTESGQQPGPLRVCGRPAATATDRRQSCVPVPRREFATRGQICFSLLGFFLDFTVHVSTCETSQVPLRHSD